MRLLYLILVIEILAFLVSLLIYSRKNVHLYLRFFPIFLFVTVVVEAIGHTMREKGIGSIPMYNYFTVFEFVFYYFVLSNIIKNYRVSKIIQYATILYPIVAIIYILTQNLNAFHTLTYSIGAITLVCFCVFYFFEIFKTPVIKNLFKEPSFWICAGLLIYYSCTVPLIGAWNYLNFGLELDQKVIAFILSILNYILYSSFMMAFFCFLKFRNPTSEST